MPYKMIYNNLGTSGGATNFFFFYLGHPTDYQLSDEHLFLKNAQAGVNDILYLILERKYHELSRTATNFPLFVLDS